MVLQPGYDFDRHDRAVLVALCERLAERVRRVEAALSRSLAEPTGLATASLDERVAALEDEVGRLSRVNALLRDENEALRRLLDRDTPAEVSSPLIDGESDDGTAADVAAAAGEAEPRYRYEYDLYRIREEDEVDIDIDVVRRTTDGRTILIEREDRFRDDVIGLRVYFRNDEPRAGKFSMAILVGRVYSTLRGDRREVLGRAVHSTAVLQPGELTQFDLELRTDDPHRVSRAEIGRVRFFPDS